MWSPASHARRALSSSSPAMRISAVWLRRPRAQPFLVEPSALRRTVAPRYLE